MLEINRKLFFLFLLIIFIAFNTTFMITYVPSGSMLPTLKIGDFFLIEKINSPSDYKHDDIVVFVINESHQLVVKRLIGLPGDVIQVTSHGTYRNGILLDEPYVQNMGGKNGVYIVPKGTVFLLGDNRTNSLDSRYWTNPYLDRKLLLGKVYKKLFNSKRISGTL